MTLLFESKQLGTTGIEIPALAMGTWRYRGGVEPLRAGINLGAVFIDTAESYGTEEIVGQAIRGVRDRVFVASKVSPRHFRRPDLINAAEESLKRLGTEYIDLYQLHWPNYNIPIDETMSAMQELVQSGKVRFIGLSNFSRREFEQAQSSLSKSVIVSNQVRYSVVDRTIEDDLLPFCESKQITVLAFSPLGNGLQNLRRLDPQDVLGQVSSETGKTRAQVALNWCLCHKPVIAIFGAGSVEHVQENCGAAGWRLEPHQLEVLDRIAFRRRRPIERLARRLARRVLQKLGRNI